jgi:hypothetical protein
MGHHRKKEKDYTMTVSRKKTKQKVKPVRKDDPLSPDDRQEVEYVGAYAHDRILAKLPSAERRKIERDTFGPAAAGRRYFINRLDQLRHLVGEIVPLMEGLSEAFDEVDLIDRRRRRRGGDRGERGRSRGRDDEVLTRNLGRDRE